MSTAYHSQLWAHALTIGGDAGSLGTLSRAIASARVDLNPHQVDAALFALRSPLSKGVVLADEVGLGKTIEAGLVIAQRWAERRRRILLVLPATLRKQWQQEMEEKFHLPGVVLDGREHRRRVEAGEREPFDRTDALVLCSYAFAAGRAETLARIPWDLVVLDEAHRLRNVYLGGSRRARVLADALRHAPKLLLTATPLQNSLMELYGLASVVDPHLFGDAASFREQFVRGGDAEVRYAALRDRLAPVCTRTLRRHVQAYVRFTRRTPITQAFTPTEAEQRLYDAVSDYLQRPHLCALPAAQRPLMTLVLRKLLASSSFAIGGTLARLVARLESATEARGDVDDGDFEALEEIEDEWSDGEAPAVAADPPPADVRGELADLRGFLALAQSITANAKGDALVHVLAVALERAESLGAARKAVVFTESRRTQAYLVTLLTANGYAGRVVTLNGSNHDPHSGAIHRAWLARHTDDGHPTGVRAVDVKAAIVEAFRDAATVLVATEAAAEGVNLQFCSLVVNYDLPWNPQRVEQRIGRCHRYGQKHDVVVVNLLNEANAADLRVHALLAEKFALFDGVFGASDEVLGALESGVGLERRIAEIYQGCRTPAEITAAFDALQRQLDEEISARMAATRQAVLDHFDEQVQARLQVHRDQAQASLDERQRWLLGLTRFELGDARFDAEAPRFAWRPPEAPRPRWFNLDWQDAERRGEVFYHLDHPLAERLVSAARDRALDGATLTFELGDARVAALAPLVGRGGWLTVAVLEVQSLAAESWLLLAAVDDTGAALDDEQASLLWTRPARVEDAAGEPPPALAEHLSAVEAARLADVDRRNATWFDEEARKLDAWAQDLKVGLEAEIRELDRQIAQANRDARGVTALLDKLAALRSVRDLEGRRNARRRKLYEAHDEIDRQRDALIGQIEAQLGRRHDTKALFSGRWRLW